MKYFFANLIAHTLIFAILLLIFIICSNRTIRQKVKHVSVYFLPIALVMLLFFDVIVFVTPRLLDITAVLKKDYEIKIGVVEEIGLLDNTVVIDGVEYYINPLRGAPAKGTTVEFKSTKNSRYALEIRSLSGDNNQDNIALDVPDSTATTDKSVSGGYG